MFSVREGAMRGLVLVGLLVLVMSSLTSVARAEDASEAADSGGGSVEELLEGLRSLDPAERITAIRALGGRRAVQAVGPLARVLREDPSPEVRGWAVRSLATIGTTEARAALALAAQHDADQRVRTLATQMSGPRESDPFAQPGVASQQPAPLVQQPHPATYSPVMEGPFRGPFSARRRRPGLGLIIAGWAVFGGSYLISMIVGAASLADGAENTWSLFLPVIGPIVEAGFLFNDYDSDLVAPLAILLFIDGLAQIAGVAMGTVGLVRRHRARQGTEGQETEAEPTGEAPAEDHQEESSAARRWGLALVPSRGGLALSGWF